MISGVPLVLGLGTRMSVILMFMLSMFLTLAPSPSCAILLKLQGAADEQQVLSREDGPGSAMS